MLNKTYCTILEWDYSKDGHYILDKVIAKGLVNYMRSKDYILKGNWREVDLCFNLHSNRWLKEFFELILAVL